MKCYRLSSYNIYADQSGNSDEFIVVNGITGIIGKVSGKLLDYHSRKYFEASRGDFTEKEFHYLSRSGFITDMTPTDEENYFSKIVSNIKKNRLTIPPHYIFILTYDCNLRCVYCYQDNIRKNRRNSGTQKRIEKTTVDNIFRALNELESNCKVTPDYSRRYGFYGGESLLAVNKDIVEYIIKKAKGYGKSKFMAVTNACELEAYENLLGPDDISSIQVTLDGPKTIHDKNRAGIDGSGTFERISKNIMMALKHDVKVFLRANVNKTNIHNLPALADEIISRGWDRYNNFSVYAGLIHEGNENIERQNTLTPKELLSYFSDCIKSNPTLQIFRQPENILTDRIAKCLKQGKSLMGLFKPAYCGAYGGTYAFDETGNFYSCLETDTSSHFMLGRIDETGNVFMNQENVESWWKYSVTSNEVCRKCSYGLFCGGGCGMRAKEKTGTMLANHCNDFQSQFRFCVERAWEKCGRDVIAH